MDCLINRLSAQATEPKRYKTSIPSLQELPRAAAARGWAGLDGSALGLLAAVDAGLGDTALATPRKP